jgi:hypothetical protein
MAQRTVQDLFGLAVRHHQAGQLQEAEQGISKFWRNSRRIWARCTIWESSRFKRVAAIFPWI